MGKKKITPAAATIPGAADTNQAPTTLEAALEVITDLKQQLSDAMQNNQALQTALDEAEQQLDESRKNKTVPTAKGKSHIPDKSFKVDGVDYVFTHPKFHWKGSVVTASEALLNRELLEELVKISSGVIKRKGQ